VPSPHPAFNGAVIPRGWTPYRRPRDGELVGYLAAEGELAVPLTVFGSPLAAAAGWSEAIAMLERDGLSSLSERWQLRLDGGEDITVMILSAFPDRVEVVRADYGIYSHDSDRYTLLVPTEGRLHRD
jgi:predicted ABC-type transport system involved in lysophospholipase L1 biosynthesis ATPase subunit